MTARDHQVNARISDSGLKFIIDRAHGGLTNPDIVRLALAFAAEHKTDFDRYLSGKRRTF